MKKIIRVLLVPIVLASGVAGTARAEEITDWNKIMFQAALTEATSPLNMSRFAAIVQSAVFDAVNGIERRYTPFRVEEPNAPLGASRAAAAVQASYATLVKIYPAQKSALDAKRAASLAAIAGDPTENGVSVTQGIEWGQTVADAIWTWRSTDGFTPAPPAFIGGNAVGQWRPTPPGLLPGAGPQFASMTPWVIKSPAQFRPAGPPALSNARYLADFDETKLMGRVDSPRRSADQTQYSARSGSFGATFSGSNLSDRTYFDVRFRRPGDLADQVAFNWQQGTFARHTLPVGTEPGIWIVTGIRAHQDLNDGTGAFVPISTTLNVNSLF